MKNFVIGIMLTVLLTSVCFFGLAEINQFSASEYTDRLSEIVAENLVIREDVSIQEFDTTTIKNGLMALTTSYKEQLLAVDCDDEYDQISNLVIGTELLHKSIFEAYMMSDYGIVTHSEVSSRGILYDFYIATAIVSFYIAGWRLAAELLGHMWNNTDLYSIYTPTNWQEILNTPTITQLLQGTHGSGFGQISASEHMGGFFALNRFVFNRSGSRRGFVITDLYDFERGVYRGSFWNTIVGIPSDIMARAQAAGVLTSFYTVIEIPFNPGVNISNPITTINASLNHPDNRFFERVFVLGRGESKYFNLIYANASRRILQTFGHRNTRIDVLNASGQLIATNSGGGFQGNALVNHIFQVGVTYRVRVRLLDSTQVARIRFSGMTTFETSTTYNNFRQIYQFAPQFIAWTETHNTVVSTFTVDSNRDITINLNPTSGGFVIMQVVILDPRSTVGINHPHSQNRMHSHLDLVTINTRIARNVPYLILVSILNNTSTMFHFGIS